MFVNSITVFEGVLRFLKKLPPASFSNTAVGCFDWDPLASFLPLPVFMVRQNTERIVAQAYLLIDHYPETKNMLVKIPPDLVEY